MEWYYLDYEYAQTPADSSEVFTVANYNSTAYGFSQGTYLAIDQRGYITLLHGQASEFLQKNDPRLLLNTIVEKIDYVDNIHNNSVTITNKDGTCIRADYVINTFSLGVLKSTDVTFTPPLPAWKQHAIDTFEMGTYTKIFLQFPKPFWNTSTEFFLYASETRGYLPIFQSLDHASFFPGSNTSS